MRRECEWLGPIKCSAVRIVYRAWMGQGQYSKGSWRYFCRVHGERIDGKNEGLVVAGFKKEFICSFPNDTPCGSCPECLELQKKCDCHTRFLNFDGRDDLCPCAEKGEFTPRTEPSQLKKQTFGQELIESAKEALAHARNTNQEEHIIKAVADKLLNCHERKCGHGDTECLDVDNFADELKRQLDLLGDQKRTSWPVRCNWRHYPGEGHEDCSDIPIARVKIGDDWLHYCKEHKERTVITYCKEWILINPIVEEYAGPYDNDEEEKNPDLSKWCTTLGCQGKPHKSDQPCPNFMPVRSPVDEVVPSTQKAMDELGLKWPEPGTLESQPDIREALDLINSHVREFNRIMEKYDGVGIVKDGDGGYRLFGLEQKCVDKYGELCPFYNCVVHFHELMGS